MCFPPFVKPFMNFCALTFISHKEQENIYTKEKLKHSKRIITDLVYAVRATVFLPHSKFVG